MYNYQSVNVSQKFGGARSVFTGTSTGITSGYYAVDETTVPELKDGIVPAGTPVFADDAKRTAAFHYAFEVVSGGSTTQIRVKKGFEGSRARTGMHIMVAPETADATGTAVTITAVDRSNADYDVLTCSTLTGADSEGTILVEADQAGGSAKIKVLPNGLQPFDFAKLPDGTMMRTDALFCQADGVVLERRIPPIAPCVKAYMADVNGGNTFFRFSKSQE